MRRVRSYEETEVILEKTFKSTGFRIGLGLIGVGGLTALVGLGDFITDSNDRAEAMVAGGFGAAILGATIATVSGNRVIQNHDNQNRV